MYELTYVCENCETRWNEIITKEKLDEIVIGEHEIMSTKFLYLLFTHGMEIHHCKFWLNQELVDGITSYGKCIAIRPVEEEDE
jgi:hypothetical protein